MRVLLDQSLMSHGHRCPCLTCTVKIAQVGISEVVYAHGYNMDESVRNCKMKYFVFGGIVVLMWLNSERRHTQVCRRTSTTIYSSKHFVPPIHSIDVDLTHR